MKTIKQLREEYNSKTLDQVQSAPDELMLEGRENTSVSKRVIPLSDVPPLLMFRRVAYRLYPNKQTVALYYSKSVDKYLSVPFGPGGNLNLSESTFHDTLEEGAKWEAAKGAFEGGVYGGTTGAALGTVAGAPGYALGGAIGAGIGAYKGAKKAYKKAKEQNMKETFLTKLNEKRKENVDEGMVDAITGYLSKKLLGGGSSDSSDTSKEPVFQRYREPTRAAKAPLKKRSSWEKAGSSDATFQAKQRAAANKELSSTPQKVAENKISDLRNMIKEDKQEMNLSINGRSVTLNTTMAKRILEVYDSVNTKNKKIVESMLNEDLESFKKLLNFSIKA